MVTYDQTKTESVTFETSWLQLIFSLLLITFLDYSYFYVLNVRKLGVNYLKTFCLQDLKLMKGCYLF